MPEGAGKLYFLCKQLKWYISYIKIRFDENYKCIICTDISQSVPSGSNADSDNAY